MSPSRVILGTLTTLALGAPPLSAQARPTPESFVGSWKGPLQAGAMTLTLVFHVEAADGGGFKGTMDSPDQGAMGIPATSVTVSGDTLRFEVAPLQATFVATLSADGATLTGTFNQGPASLPLSLTRGEAEAPERPQNPSLPLPYRSSDVEIPSAGGGVTLAGTLTLPDGAGPFPAVVLVSGSGPQDRDEALMGHKPFLVLSDHLTRKGIAVLRYDDRGVGKSTGTFSSATSEDFTTDALAALEFLRNQPGIGPVGIVGHSEGGLVGPMAAARSDAVRFVVMLAGPGLPGRDILKLQGELIARAAGAPEEAVEANAALQERMFDIVAEELDPALARPRLLEAIKAAVAAQQGDTASKALEAEVDRLNSPWFRFFLDYDPRSTLARVKVPVLALNGSLDLQVPAEIDLKEVEAALRKGGNTDVTTRLLPGLNHLFQTARTGSPAEYAQITETMSPTALEAVSSWILERFGGR